MYKDTLKDSGAGDKFVKELQVEAELQGLSNCTPEEDHTDQEDGDDEDVGDQETDQTPDLIDYQLVRDREPRTRTKPLRFQDESNMGAYVFAAAEEEDTHEPLTYQESVSCEDSSKWKAAMEEEMDSLRKNKTWELVDHPAGQKLMSCKWLFKIKEMIEGVQKPRYKARLVARAFTQRAGIDYNKVFSLVVRHTSIRVILALTTCKDYELEQLDVKIAFLHGNLEEVIYMKQTPGYEQGNRVCLLKKSLYGLKQSPRQWYKRFDEYMLNNGFKCSSYGSCVYYKSYAPEVLEAKTVKVLKVRTEHNAVDALTNVNLTTPIPDDLHTNNLLCFLELLHVELLFKQRLGRPNLSLALTTAVTATLESVVQHVLIKPLIPLPSVAVTTAVYITGVMHQAEIGSTKSLLKKEFDMKELEEAKKIIGMEIVRDRSRKILRVSQSGYVSKILNNFRIDNGKSVKMPLGGH
nr:retrovirus-related Pol polyprotein from transposon TNT 1-94 [Tanacetum cinerariifolium]